jgi:hypothetical protein
VTPVQAVDHEVVDWIWYDTALAAMLVITIFLVGAWLSGCTSQNGVITPTLTPAAQATVQNYLNTYCPVLPGVQLTLSANPSLNTTDVKAATALLASVCPPNPAPTNGVVIASDVLGAYTTLKPLIHK